MTKLAIRFGSVPLTTGDTNSKLVHALAGIPDTNAFLDGSNTFELFKRTPDSAPVKPGVMDDLFLRERTVVFENLDDEFRARRWVCQSLLKFTRRTSKPAYPSGWAYALHYGAQESDPPRTLPDGTIRRYDNAHEDTKGHELHVAGQPTQIIQFPGMVALWQRFWSEVPKVEFDPTN